MTAEDQNAQTTAADARRDWRERIYRRTTGLPDDDASLRLPAPKDMAATARVGHVQLSWAPVPGAAGYVIERSDVDGANPVILDHGGSDVAAVAQTSYADAGPEVAASHRYRVGAVAGSEFPVFEWSEPTDAVTSLTGEPDAVRVSVNAGAVTGPLQRVWRMVGSERLSQLREGRDEHGHDIGAEFLDALRIAREELGVERVRAHAILHDDNAVVSRSATGELHHDFSAADDIYDTILSIGLRPVVEVSFMPAALASDPAATVFDYRAIISPPRDWDEWRTLVASFVEHLVARYGIDEVLGWPFEVWNEANLEVFWTGSPEDYLRLYDETADAVKSVDPRLRVGGPSSAAAEWVHLLASHCHETGTPLDFLTSHTYGNVPLDVATVLDRLGAPRVPVWWTEWGVGHTHFGPLNDAAYGAAFALNGVHDVQGRLDALAYWVISDHFEELGRGPRLFHNGFGLLTVGNLRKPRFWAIKLAEELADDVLDLDVTGDGAEVLVHAWATRGDDGTVDVLVWNIVPNAALAAGDDALGRVVDITVEGLADATYAVDVARIDKEHSNIASHLPLDVDWPDADQWAALRQADQLHEEPYADANVQGGVARCALELPMPSVARLRLRPTSVSP